MEHYFYQEPQGNNYFRDLAKYDNMFSLIEVSWSFMIILPIHKKIQNPNTVFTVKEIRRNGNLIDPFHIKYMTNYLVFPRQ